jgi:hypothetical protein
MAFKKRKEAKKGFKEEELEKFERLTLEEKTLIESGFVQNKVESIWIYEFKGKIPSEEFIQTRKLMAQGSCLYLITEKLKVIGKVKGNPVKIDISTLWDSSKAKKYLNPFRLKFLIRILKQGNGD